MRPSLSSVSIWPWVRLQCRSRVTKRAEKSDRVHPEWNRKVVTSIIYGSLGGARAIEQLRQVAIETQLAPIPPAVHIPAAAIYAYFQDKDITPHRSSWMSLPSK
jgi:hypothetical protein